MCFSASVSFGGSAVLAVIGVVSMVSARSTAQRVLAGIPLIFAIQQFSEGVLWVALQNPVFAHWERTATYAFLLFAQVVWPVYIPLAMLFFERDPKRKKLMVGFLISGIALGLFLCYGLYSGSVHAVARDHHIRYDLGMPVAEKWYFGLLYFVPTIVSSLFSSVKRLHLLGYLFFISYVVARVFFHFFVISVWCFFGAVISIVVLNLIFRSKRADKLSRQLISGA